MIPPFPVEEYKMVEGTTASSLSTEVNRLVQDGWAIWGSPTSSANKYAQHYSQAMIKFEQPQSRFVDENHPPDEHFSPEHFEFE